MIIGVYGLPGSGKTELCRYLASKYGAVHIEVDKLVGQCLQDKNYYNRKAAALLKCDAEESAIVRNAIADAFFQGDLDSDVVAYYHYKSIEEKVLEAISPCDDSSYIIIDWAYLAVSSLVSFADVLIQVSCNADIMRQRLIERDGHVDDRKSAITVTKLSLRETTIRPQAKIDTSNSKWKSLISDYFDKCIIGSQVISVVIPVYNGERWLARCLESVITQTYRLLEIIIIDDGSTDSSPIIASYYARKDVRIRIITQENLGLASARNAGIDSACGECIAFLDVDDYLEPNAYEILLKNLIETESDAVSCRAYIHDRYGSSISGEAPEGKGAGLFAGAHKCASAYVEGEMTFAVWDKLFVKATIDDIRFDGTLFNEDADFMIRYALAGYTISCIPNQLYHHVKSVGNTLTGKPFDERLFLTKRWADSMSLMIGSLGSNYLDIAIKLKYNSYSHVLKTYMRDYKRGVISNQYKAELTEIVTDITNIILDYPSPECLIDISNTLNVINELKSKQLASNGGPTKTIKCIGVLWNALDHKQMEHAIRMIGCRSEVQRVGFVELPTSEYETFIDDIYYFNDQTETKQGTAVFKKRLLVDRYLSNEICVLAIEVAVENVVYDKKHNRFNYAETLELKECIRDYFKVRINDYAFDNVFHLTSNEQEYEYTYGVCREYLKDLF